MLISVRRPNLFIIGVSKCATTTLWGILRGHPDIFMSHVKEPSYFVRSDHETKRLSYLSLFEGAQNEPYLGEASPVYSETTVFPEVAKRIYEFNPEAKIILIVREPYDRLMSIWRQSLYSGHWYRDHYHEKYGKEGVGLMPTKFESAVIKYPRFVEATKYWSHLEAYRNHFSDDNILLLFYEDLLANQSGIVDSIYQFLDLKSIHSVVNRHYNKGLNKKMVPAWYAGLSDKGKARFNYFIPKYLFERVVKRKIVPGNLPSAVRDEIKMTLEDEVRSILAYGRKSQDYWSPYWE